MGCCAEASRSPCLCRCKARRGRCGIPAGWRLLHANAERRRRAAWKGLCARDDNVGKTECRRHEERGGGPEECLAGPGTAWHVPPAAESRSFLDVKQLP